jgi:hypothetical protein
MLLHVWEAHFPYRSPPHFDDRWDKAGYEAAVNATDQGLAPVLEAVPVEKTLVVLTGDHGERFPRTRLGARVSRAGRRVRRELRLATRAPHLNMKLAARGTGHGFGLEEGLIRVPLVFAGPGIPAGVVQDDQVSHVDLLPTLAELCGLGAPTGVDGRTITSLMSGRPLPERPVYMEAVGLALKAARIEGSRLPGWKLLRTDRGMERLLRVDRGRRAERRVRGARYPRMRDELRAFLDAVTSRTKATTGMTSEEEEALEEHLRALGYVE